MYEAILQKVQQMHGDYGVAAIRSGFTAKYCNENTRIALIRIRHGPHLIVTSCLPLITRIDDTNIDINTLYTGATIRQCYRFLLKYQQTKFHSFYGNLKTDDERLKFNNDFMNVNDTVFEKF